MHARFLLTAAVAALTATASAQTEYGYAAAADSIVPAVADSTLCIVDRINASEYVRVSEPAALTAMLTRTVRPAEGNGASEGEAASTVVATRNGYRVQVFDDNNPGTARAQAEAKRVQFENAFPQWRAYVTFNSPYWQVRVGDFKRRGEAEAALAQIRDAMPSVSAYARIVAEKINITE